MKYFPISGEILPKQRSRGGFGEGRATMLGSLSSGDNLQNQNMKELISFLWHHGNVVGTLGNIQLMALPNSRISLQRMFL